MSHLNMSKIVLRSVFKKPATVLYPFEKKETVPLTRGHIQINIEACSMCTLCQKKCPTGAITVLRNEKIWQIDRLKCITCNACVESCPKKCLSMEPMYSPSVTVKSVETYHPSQEAPAAPPVQ